MVVWGSRFYGLRLICLLHLIYPPSFFLFFTLEGSETVRKGVFKDGFEVVVVVVVAGDRTQRERRDHFFLQTDMQDIKRERDG